MFGGDVWALVYQRGRYPLWNHARAITVRPPTLSETRSLKRVLAFVGAGFYLCIEWFGASALPYSIAHAGAEVVKVLPRHAQLPFAEDSCKTVRSCPLVPVVANLGENKTRGLSCRNMKSG